MKPKNFKSGQPSDMDVLKLSLSLFLSQIVIIEENFTLQVRQRRHNRLWRFIVRLVFLIELVLVCFPPAVLQHFAH